GKDAKLEDAVAMDVLAEVLKAARLQPRPADRIFTNTVCGLFSPSGRASHGYLTGRRLRLEMHYQPKNQRSGGRPSLVPSGAVITPPSKLACRKSSRLMLSIAKSVRTFSTTWGKLKFSGVPTHMCTLSLNCQKERMDLAIGLTPPSGSSDLRPGCQA